MHPPLTRQQPIQSCLSRIIRSRTSVHRTGPSARAQAETTDQLASQVIGRESVGNASGPASPILTEYGRRVGSLGPGLTSESADAVRAVLRDDLSAGSQVFTAPTSGAGLICPAWTRGLGFPGPTGQRVRAIPQPQKGMAVTIVEEARPITGGGDTHADTHVAAALDSVRRLLRVRGVPPPPARCCRPLGWLGGGRG